MAGSKGGRPPAAAKAANPTAVQGSIGGGTGLAAARQRARGLRQAAGTQEPMYTAHTPPNGDIAVLGVAEKRAEGHKTLSDLKEELTSRGFEVMLFTPEARDGGKTFVLVLRVGAGLLDRAAPKLGLIPGPNNVYSKMDRAALVTVLVENVKKVLEAFEHADVFILHDDQELTKLMSTDSDAAVAEYCGSEVALYFEWLKFYTKFLLFPALAGLGLFVCEMMGKPPEELVWTPLFQMSMAVWGTLLLEGWKRRNARKAFEWGVLEKPDVMEKFEATGGKDGPRRLSPAYFLYGVSLPITVGFILLLVQVFFYFNWLSDHYLETYGPDSKMQYIPTALYSIVPPVAQAVYSSFVGVFNAMEGHDTVEAAQASLQFKTFCFHFVNSFISLFYIAFYLKDMARLRAVLLSILFSKQLIGNLQESVLPLLGGWINDATAPDRQAVRGEAVSDNVLGGEDHKVVKVVKGLFVKLYRGTVGRVTSSKAKLDAMREDFVKAQGDLRSQGLLVESREVEGALEAQRGYGDFNPDDEHIEMLVQFGFLSMFTMAFPLAPLGAFLNNIWEARLDRDKLRVSRRPPVRLVKTIGGWFRALEFMSLLSVLSNCLLMAIISKKVHMLVPAALHVLLESVQGRVLLALGVEHLLFALKFLMSAVIPDVPSDVQRELHRRTQMEREALAPQIAKIRPCIAFNQDARAAFEALSRPEAPMVSMKSERKNLATGVRVQEFEEAENATKDGEQQLAKRAASFNVPTREFPVPMLMALGACLLAWAMGRLEFSWLWSILCGAGVAYAILTLKDRLTTSAVRFADRNAQRKRVISDVESVEWINATVHRFFQFYEPILCDQIRDAVAPVLEGIQVPGISKLEMGRLTLGKKPPFVQSAQFLTRDLHGNPIAEDRILLILDLGFHAPDLEVVISAKTPVGASIPLAVKEIWFQGKMQVELQLVPRMSFAKTAIVNFMQPPIVDFSVVPLKTGNIFNVPGLAGFIQGLIINGINDTLVDPEKLVLDLMPPQTGEVEASCGVLFVTVREGAYMDAGMADPLGMGLGASQVCVEVKIGSEARFTSGVSARGDGQPFSLNEETICLLVKGNLSAEKVCCYLKQGRKGKLLGRVYLPVAEIANAPDCFLSETLQFQNVEGHISLDLKFCPLPKVCVEEGDEMPADQEVMNEDGSVAVVSAPELADVADSPTGALLVRVHRARGLAAKDANGLSDPFVELYYTNRLLARTKTVEQSLAPLFDFNKEITVGDIERVKLTLRVFDADALGAEGIGDFDVDLSEVFAAHAATPYRAEKLWFPLRKPGKPDGSGSDADKFGMVQLSFIFRPTGVPPSVKTFMADIGNPGDDLSITAYDQGGLFSSAPIADAGGVDATGCFPKKRH